MTVYMCLHGSQLRGYLGGGVGACVLYLYACIQLVRVPVGRKRWRTLKKGATILGSYSYSSDARTRHVTIATSVRYGCSALGQNGC